MKNIRNVAFYALTIGVFSTLLYHFISDGQKLQVPGIMKANPVPAGSPWTQFSDTFHHNLTHPLALLLLQIVSIIVVARVFGYFCKKIGQPSVIGEIAAGIFLGPSLLGLYFPEFSDFLFPVKSLGNLQILSQIGLILFMFIIGMELDLKILKTKAQEAVVISHASIIVPFALGVGMALLLYPQYAPVGIGFLSFSLFIGIALSITAFPVLARIVQERGLSKTKLGIMVITCAATDDITAWCILAGVVAIVKAGTFVSALYTAGFAAIYVLLMLYAVRPFLKRIGDYHTYREGLTKPVVALFFVMLLLSAYCTEIIGIHALFGAFLAGVVMPVNHNFRSLFIEKVEDVSMVLLLPLFFVFTGLRTQISLLNDAHTWQITGLIIAAAVAGKFIGSAVAARFVRQNWRDSLIIGSLMNTRGLMELVVLNIGYDIGVLSPQIFAMMVIMALVTTCMTGPALDLIDRFLPEQKTVAKPKTQESTAFSILIAFANPQGGTKMLWIAERLSRGTSRKITALHLSPSSYLGQVNTREYQEETFKPIHEQTSKLEIQITPLIKPSQQIEQDIIETANAGAYDLLLMGIGHSVFEGTILGKVLGITNKFTSPTHLLSVITGKENLFDNAIFDDRTAHILEGTKTSVGILIEKNLTKTDHIFITLLGLNDLFLIAFAQKLSLHPEVRITLADPHDVLRDAAEVTAAIRAMQLSNPDSVSIRKGSFDEQGILEQQDLVLIGLESWKQEINAQSAWLSQSPSVLIIRS
jgi:Kef-type K+ transport system membrane component KefB